MTDRLLPISDGFGNLKEMSLFAVMARMAYPDDPISAEVFLNAVKTGAKAAHEGKVNEEYIPRALEVLYGDIDRKFGKCIVAGLVYSEVCQMARHTADPSIRKAVAFASEQVKSKKSEIGNRSPIPSDERSIRDAFSKFRNVGHLWAAYLWSTTSLNEFGWFEFMERHELFLGFLNLSRFALNEFRQAKPAEVPSPWMVPEDLRLPKLSLVFRDLDLRSEFLARYRPTEFRG